MSAQNVNVALIFKHRKIAKFNLVSMIFRNFFLFLSIFWTNVAFCIIVRGNGTNNGWWIIVCCFEVTRAEKKCLCDHLKIVRRPRSFFFFYFFSVFSTNNFLDKNGFCQQIQLKQNVFGLGKFEFLRLKFPKINLDQYAK